MIRFSCMLIVMGVLSGGFYGLCRASAQNGLTAWSCLESILSACNAVFVWIFILIPPSLIALLSFLMIRAIVRWCRSVLGREGGMNFFERGLVFGLPAGIFLFCLGVIYFAVTSDFDPY